MINRTWLVTLRAAASALTRERGRVELLNETLFRSLRHARDLIEDWRIDYNDQRPHTSLDGLTPSQFAARSKQDHNQNSLYL